MSESAGYVTEAFETTSGDVWYKANDSMGRTYRVKKGEGQVSQQQYKAAKSHKPEVAISERGADPERATENTTSFDGETIQPTTSMDDRGTVEYRLGVENNRFTGFLNADDTPNDRLEAIKQYSNMIDELKDADDSEERQEIRKSYGVGGS